MSEVRESSPLPDLDAIAAAAWALEPPAPHERKWVLRSEAGLLLDKLLARCARGRGALDVAIGDGLAAMAVGDRVVQLGFSGIGDYAIEELGIARRTAQKLAQLARGLREWPELRASVWSGETTPRKAEIVLRLARDDAQEEWVSRARTQTVRALQADTGSDASSDDERWERIGVRLSPKGPQTLDEATSLVRNALGATTPRSACLEVICQEYLGTHAVPDDDYTDVLHAAVPRHYQASEERQMCTRRELDLRVPVHVRILLAAAIGAARKAAGRWLTPGECLEAIAQHFVDTWGPALRGRKTPQDEVLARERGFCLAPKCSKCAAHAHHVDYRAHGGSDEESNLASLCAVHHLRGVHGGWLR